MAIPREIDDALRDGGEPSTARPGKTQRVRTLPSNVSVRLTLTDKERSRFADTDFTVDGSDRECLVGLSHAESLDYIELQRRGLDNDDEAFLRYIQLGDRHVIARRSPYAF